jgi:hypothetical protein
MTENIMKSVHVVNEVMFQSHNNKYKYMKNSVRCATYAVQLIYEMNFHYQLLIVYKFPLHMFRSTHRPSSGGYTN